MRMRVVDCKECDAHDYCCKVKETSAVLLASPPSGMAICDICHGDRFIKIMRYPKNEDGLIVCGHCNGTGWVEIQGDKPPEETSETEVKPCVHCDAKQKVIDGLEEAVRGIYDYVHANEIKQGDQPPIRPAHASDLRRQCVNAALKGNFDIVGE